MQLLNLPTEQVKQGIDLLQIHKSKKPMKLSEIRKEINTAKNARMAKTKVNQMFIVITTIGSIVILIESMDSQPAECPSSSARANSNEPGKSKLGQPEGFGRAGLTGGDHETTQNPLVKSRENPALEATREQPA